MDLLTSLARVFCVHLPHDLTFLTTMRTRNEFNSPFGFRRFMSLTLRLLALLSKKIIIKKKKPQKKRKIAQNLTKRPLKDVMVI